MKKQHKIKLVLNSQTIRRLHSPGLEQVQGGRVQVLDTVDQCAPTDNCRGCG